MGTPTIVKIPDKIWQIRPAWAQWLSWLSQTWNRSIHGFCSARNRKSLCPAYSRLLTPIYSRQRREAAPLRLFTSYIGLCDSSLAAWSRQVAALSNSENSDGEFSQPRCTRARFAGVSVAVRTSVARDVDNRLPTVSHIRLRACFVPCRAFVDSTSYSGMAGEVFLVWMKAYFKSARQ